MGLLLQEFFYLSSCGLTEQFVPTEVTNQRWHVFDDNAYALAMKAQDYSFLCIVPIAKITLHLPPLSSGVIQSGGLGS